MDLTAIKCEFHLHLEPENIIRWNLAGKPIHGCGIAFKGSDPVTKYRLKRCKRSFLLPLVQDLLSFVKTAQNEEGLACVGVERRSGGPRIVDCPIEFL